MLFFVLMLFERYLNAVKYVCDFWNFRLSFCDSGLVRFRLWFWIFRVFRFGDYISSIGYSALKREQKYANPALWQMLRQRVPALNM